MKSMKFIGCLYLLALLSACGSRTSDYDATGNFRSYGSSGFGEASGKLLSFMLKKVPAESRRRSRLIDTLQLYTEKLQLQASMKSVESQRPDVNKQIAATRQQIATARRREETRGKPVESRSRQSEATG